jgi:hypothetical protein
MIRTGLVFALCVGCGSSTVVSDGGIDATTGDAGAQDASCSAPATDASFTCNVSSVSPADLACGDWVGSATLLDGGGLTCPASLGWNGGIGSQCEYKWKDSPPTPNLCELPPNGPYLPFQWLRPNCGSGCPAPDAGGLTSCTTTSECPSGEYCQLQNCAPPGECYPIGGGVGVPEAVCGCDNKTYSSATSAQQAGVSIAYAGTCE